MKKALLPLFCLTWQFAFSQSNIAFYAGPEFNFIYRDQLAIGINAESQFVHQWKNRIGIQSGVNFKWISHSDTYPIDSTPSNPSGLINTSSDSIRGYDYTLRYCGMGLTFDLSYNMKLSRRISLSPLAGFKIGFDFVNKFSYHYYTVDTSGIADPGPFYNEYNLTEGLLPDRFSLAAGCSLNYLCSRKVSISFLPTADMTWAFKNNEYLSKVSFPIKFGAIYLIGK